MAERKKILFICGSLNQTTQMHKVAMHLPEYDHKYCQFFGGNWFLRALTKYGFLESSIMGPKSSFWKASMEYINAHNLEVDTRAEKYRDEYEMVVSCNDLTTPRFFSKKKVVWVQEGMIDRPSRLDRILHALKFSRWITRTTAYNGLAKCNDVLCVASEGYKDHFMKLGIPESKIIVTGIPNFDNLASSTKNSFPLNGYVMVATSDIRETHGSEDRADFLRKCAGIASGRQLLFKPHPNENFERAKKEIDQWCPPGSLFLTEGDTNQMIANCDELITQWSSVVYTGIALGKKVHSWFNIDELNRFCPIQNGGTSSVEIANICRRLLEWEGPKKQFKL